MRIVSIGELLVDLTQTSVNEYNIPAYYANPGGAPANLAVAASLSGADSAFIGKVGDDSFGNMLIDTLKSKNVDVSAVIKDKTRPTTLAVVSHDAKGERSFSFYRNGCADTALEFDEINIGIIKNADIFHFGSVSLCSEPSASATFAAVKAAKNEGAVISYDPNYRPLLWDSEKQAVQKIKQALHLVDIIKVSDGELSLITEEYDVKKGAQKLLDYGVKLVIVTLGANGAYYLTDGFDSYQEGIKVNVVVDTNGAGDTFFGAFLSRIDDFEAFLHDCDKISQAVRFACYAAALSVSGSGAIPSMPTYSETLKLMKTYRP